MHPRHFFFRIEAFRKLSYHIAVRRVVFRHNPGDHLFVLFILPVSASDGSRDFFCSGTDVSTRAVNYGYFTITTGCRVDNCSLDGRLVVHLPRRQLSARTAINSSLHPLPAEPDKRKILYQGVTKLLYQVVAILQNSGSQRSMIQIGGLCFGGNQVHLFHLLLLPHFAPKCRWGIKEKPLITIDYQRFSLFYYLFW